MPDQNTNAVDAANAAIEAAKTEVVSEPSVSGIVADIIAKIRESKYILIALSGGPSIDELSAAIGLSTYLNKLGKRATAIYSGGIPDVLSFLEAGTSFDRTADVMQDFVISLDKDKADHLRYKPEGDAVKIYITPYKDKVTADDLDFSYGDFNVDLVLALNVVSGIDLDDALREYGRIMQDAKVVNITSGRPGKLADIEWSNPQASSVSEMAAHLLHEMNDEVPVGKEEATAFFAGIVSATNRFSNASTTPFTLTVSSWLMECGANQQLVAENITADIDNQIYANVSAAKKTDDSNMEIAHEEPVSSAETEGQASEVTPEATEPEEVTTPVAEPDVLDSPVEQGVEPVANVAEEVAPQSPAEEIQPSEADTDLANLKEIQDALLNEEDLTVSQPVKAPVDIAALDPIDIEHGNNVLGGDEGLISDNKETVIAVPESFNPGENKEDNGSKFGKMLEDALSDGSNPAVVSAPVITAQPEINNVPDINYTANASEDILPPPPAPAAIPGMPPATPQVSPTQPIQQPVPSVQPVAEPVQAATQPMSQTAQVAPQAAPEAVIQSRPPVQLVPPQPTAEGNQGIADPGAFRIPGM